MQRFDDRKRHFKYKNGEGQIRSKAMRNYAAAFGEEDPYKQLGDLKDIKLLLECIYQQPLAELNASLDRWWVWVLAV